MAINVQIAELIKKLNIKKVQFARDLKIDQSHVTRLISGENKPSERLIDDICDRYNVNKEWLITGNGETFNEMSREDEINFYLGSLLNSDNSFKENFVKVLSRLTVDDWEVMEKIAKMMSEDNSK